MSDSTFSISQTKFQLISEANFLVITEFWKSQFRNNLTSYFQLTLISQYLLNQEWEPFQIV